MRARAPARFVLVAFVVFCLYLPSLRNGFVDWDDDKNFLNNLAYRGLGAPQLHWMWTTFHLGPYQPLSWMTLGLDYVLWGMKPAGYHATSVLLHSLSAGLFAVVAAGLYDRHGGKNAAAFGVLASAIWALHPLRVEAVSWITERREVLCGALTLLALASHLGGRRWATIAFGVAAMLAKATAVVVPVILVVIDVYDEAGPDLASWDSAAAASVRRHLPLFLAAIALGVAAIFGQHEAAAAASLTRVGAGARVALFGHGLGFYPWKTLWPAGLAPLYELRSDLGPIYRSGAAGYLALAIAAALAIRFRRQMPALLLLLLAYVVFVAPIGGLMQAGEQSAADRYCYQASWALSLIAAGGIALWARRRTSAPYSMYMAAAVAIAVPLSVLTVRQQHAWKDAESLWTRQLAARPDTATAHYSLANLRVTREHSHEADVWAEPHFREAIRLRPDKSEAYRGLGNDLRRQGRVDEAIAVYREGLRIAPSNGPIVYGLATAEWKSGDREQALTTLRRLPECPPVTADSYIVLARALAAAGRGAEAVATYEHAFDIPTEAPAVAPMELAWLLATSPDDRLRDGARAVQLSERALELGRRLAAQGGVALRADLPARLAKTHAAALAEAGRFDEAARSLQDAAGAFGQSDAELSDWIASFAAHRAIRVEPAFP